MLSNCVFFLRYFKEILKKNKPKNTIKAKREKKGINSLSHVQKRGFAQTKNKKGNGDPLLSCAQDYKNFFKRSLCSAI